MMDFDEFDDTFDAGDLGDAFEVDDPFETGSRSAPAGPPSAVPASARVLVEGETGVQFDALLLFAEPLFELYDLDLADAFALKADLAQVDPEVLALLETARVLWAFFSLPPAERARRRDALAAQLVGADPSEEDWLDIQALLDRIEPYWEAMLPEEREKAERTAHPVLDFDALLAHPAFALGDAHSPRAYGPNGLSEIEARALFAQPLLDDPDTLADADAFERAMERASTYWTLAQTPPAEREEALRAAAERLANGNGQHAAIEREARAMVERFLDLFPEHAPSA